MSAEDNSFTHFFIGGIQRNVTVEDIENYFSSYGEVGSFVLKKDTLGRSRGYGWLRFKAPTPNLPRGKHSVNGVSLIVDLAHTPQEREALAVSKQREGFRRSRSGSSYSSSSRSRSGSASRRGHTRPKSESYSTNGNHRNHSHHNGAVPVRNHVPAAPHGFVPVQVPMVPQQQVAVPASEIFVCVPMALCPPPFLQDPRVFCARLDESRLGTLQIVHQFPRPGFPNQSFPNGGVVPTQQQSAANVPNNHSYQREQVPQQQVMYMNRQFAQSSAAANPPPPGPPPRGN